MDQISKLAVILIIVALIALAAVAPASGAVSSFSNSSTILINDNAAATPYPSNITVSGVTGVVTHMTVRLFRLSASQFPVDIDALPVARAAFHADEGSAGLDECLTFDRLCSGLFLCFHR